MAKGKGKVSAQGKANAKMHSPRKSAKGSKVQNVDDLNVLDNEKVNKEKTESVTR